MQKKNVFLFPAVSAALLSVTLLSVVLLAGCNQPAGPGNEPGSTIVYSFTADVSRITHYMFSGSSFVEPDDKIITISNTGEGVLQIGAVLLGRDQYNFAISPVSAAIPIGESFEFTLQYLAGNPYGESYEAIVSFTDERTQPVRVDIEYISISFSNAEITLDEMPLRVGIPAVLSTTDPAYTGQNWFSSDDATAVINGDTVTGLKTGQVFLGFMFSDDPIEIKGQNFTVFPADVANFTALEQIITEAQDIRRLIRSSASGGSGLYYFEAWVSSALFTDFTGAIDAAITVRDNISATQDEVDGAADTLKALFDDVVDQMAPGLDIPPDGTNIAPRYAYFQVSSNDGLPAEGTNSDNFAERALTGTGAQQRWISGSSSTPILELVFAYPATVGRAGFNAQASAAGGQTPVNTYRFEYWDDADDDWKTAFNFTGIVPGDAMRSETYFARNNPFNAEYTSTRFRFNITGASGPSSFWRVSFFSATVGRYALEKAIADAQLDLDATFISVNGGDVSEDDFWVSQADADDYLLAVNAAQAVLNVMTSTADALAGAKTALDTASQIFDAAKEPGEADPEFINKLNELRQRIAWATEYHRLHKTGTNAANFYPFEFIAANTARTAFNNAIAAANSAPKTDIAEVDAARDALETAIADFDAARAVGTRELPEAGTNIATAFAYAQATNTHSALSLEGMINNTNFGSGNDSRWGTSSGNTFPTIITLVFADKVGADHFKIYSFSSVSSGGNTGRIQSFDIEYWDDDEEAWTVCFSRVSTQQIPGIVAGGLSNETTRENNAFLAEFFGRVESDKYRLVINSSSTVDPSIWHIQLLYAPPEGP